MCELGRSRRSNEEYDLLKKMSEEAFKKECLNSCEFKILGMFGVLQRQILFCGTRITAAAHESSTPSVACSVDLGGRRVSFLGRLRLAPGLNALSSLVLCTFLPHPLHNRHTRGKKMRGWRWGGGGDICQTSFRFSPASPCTPLISVPLQRSSGFHELLPAHPCSFLIRPILRVFSLGCFINAAAV